MIWWRGFIIRLAIRITDVIFCTTGLILFSPLIVLIALLVRLDSKGEIFFSQPRVGKNNIDFRLVKFRTMFVGSDRKGLITIGSKDPRVTRIGAFLRRTKLDELPQLINVLKGEMSIVGPRPEVRKYTEFYSMAQQMIVLSVRPGITDYASIQYSKESDILNDMDDPEKYYIDVVMPAKLKLNLIFIENYTFGNYLRIIFYTFIRLITQ